MTPRKLGKLAEVDLDSIPLYENNDISEFSRWLAENLDLLGNALGLRLKIVQTQLAFGNLRQTILSAGQLVRTFPLNVNNCGGGIVYHPHDEKELNWEPGGVRSGAGVFRLVRDLGSNALPAVPEAVAVAVHLQDVDVVGEPVQQRAGKALQRLENGGDSLLPERVRM